MSNTKEHVNLSRLLSKPTTYTMFSVWIIGETPLITHAWSEKARREMLQKQVKATRGGRDLRDPEADFVSSLYEISEGVYGFPAMAFKNAILSSAHKDKGIPRTAVMSALWINAEIVRTRPALAGAVCDMVSGSTRRPPSPIGRSLRLGHFASPGSLTQRCCLPIP